MDATDQRLYLLPSRATKRTLFWATTILTRYFKLLQTCVIKEHQKQQKTPTTIRCFFEITPIPLGRKIFALAWLIKFCFSIKNRKNDAFLYSFAIEFRCNFFCRAGLDNDSLNQKKPVPYATWWLFDVTKDAVNHLDPPPFKSMKRTNIWKANTAVPF